MKQLTLCAALLALLLAGCGGSDDNNSSTPPIESLGTPRIEAIVRVERTNLRNPFCEAGNASACYTDEQLLDPQTVKPLDLVNPDVSGVQDPLNFQTEESFVFQLVAYNAAGKRFVLPATFTTEDTTNTYGTLAESGLFLAKTVATSAPLAIEATYRGARYFSQYAVRERQGRVLGSILVESAIGPRTPLAGARILFFDSVGNQVGSARSDYQGAYRASVPTNAVTLTVDPGSLSLDFYRSFVYDINRFNAGDISCRAPLPTITPGIQGIEDVLITPVRRNAAGAPLDTPPATGCSAG